MKTRLFHTIIACGALLGCGAAEDPEAQVAGAAGESGESNPDPEGRCKLPDGSCNEHCRYIGQGRCLDPCFVHSTTCKRECVLPDGTCGWPPTK